MASHLCNRRSSILAIVFLLSCGASGAAERIESKFHDVEFRNSTNASIVVELIDLKADVVMSRSEVKPKSTIFVKAGTGLQIFDLNALRSDPVRVHRIGIPVKNGSRNRFNIIPHIFGTYLLEDKDSLHALATIGIAGKPMATPVNNEDAIKFACVNAGGDGFGHILWSPMDSLPAKHFLSTGNILCATDGSQIFEIGDVYRNFSCIGAWSKCVRNPDKDGTPIPPIRTSQVIDDARRMVQRYAQEPIFVRTQTFDWEMNHDETARFTSYLESREPGSSKQCPPGTRLHYQGFCIDRVDELNDGSEN